MSKLIPLCVLLAVVCIGCVGCDERTLICNKCHAEFTAIKGAPINGPAEADAMAVRLYNEHVAAQHSGDKAVPDAK